MDSDISFCTQCEKEFKSKIALSRHLKLTHGREKKFECNICKRRFGYKNILLEHQNIHFGIKPYACNLCGKRFAARSNLVQHRIVHKRPLSCTVCPQRFESDEALQEHMKGHQGTELSCNLCTFTTLNQITLNEHIHTAHATELQKPKSSCSFDKSRLRVRHLSSATQHAYDPDVLPVFQQDFPPGSNMDSSSYTDQSHQSRQDIIIKSEPKSPEIDMYLQSSGQTIPAVIQAESSGIVSFSDTQSVSDERVSTPRSYSSHSRDTGIADSTSGIADVLSKIQNCMLKSDQSNTFAVPRVSINVDPPKHTRDFSAQFTSERSDMPTVREIMSYLETCGKLFRCNHCCIMFEDRGLYILHNSLHADANPWQCAVCNKICLNKNDFHLHLANQQHA